MITLARNVLAIRPENRVRAYAILFSGEVRPSDRDDRDDARRDDRDNDARSRTFSEEVRSSRHDDDNNDNDDNDARPRRIFSGIQPTGNVHLGNYLGAIRGWVRLQNEREDVVLSVADMHSITLPRDPRRLADDVLRTTAALLACGVDPNRTVLFQQSTVPMHAELCWILGCLVTLPRLARLPQFREKSRTMQNVPLGLYVYPVLQAADILLYGATLVPVGRDQCPHVQLAQDLAVSFNKKFGDTFLVPHSLINDDASRRILSLRDPAKKMSKSSQDPRSRIDLLDEPSVIVEKVKKAVTDCRSEITYEPKERPGVANLIVVHSMLTGNSPDRICLDARGLDTGKYKLLLADLIVEKLSPIREEFSRLIDEPEYLRRVLKDGGERATRIATDCYRRVRSRIGFGNDVLCERNEKGATSEMSMRR